MPRRTSFRHPHIPTQTDTRINITRASEYAEVRGPHTLPLGLRRFSPGPSLSSSFGTLRRAAASRGQHERRGQCLSLCLSLCPLLLLLFSCLWFLCGHLSLLVGPSPRPPHADCNQNHTTNRASRSLTGRQAEAGRRSARAGRNGDVTPTHRPKTPRTPLSPDASSTAWPFIVASVGILYVAPHCISWQHAPLPTLALSLSNP